MRRNLMEDLGRLQQQLDACVRFWRAGYDAGGYDEFVAALRQLEKVVLYHFDKLPKDDSFPELLENLRTCVKNRDIMGVQDVVEYELGPLVARWLEGRIANLDDR